MFIKIADLAYLERLRLENFYKGYSIAREQGGSMTGKLPIFSRKRTLEVSARHFREALENAITNQRPEAVGYAGDILRLYGNQLSVFAKEDVMAGYPVRRHSDDPIESHLLKFYVGKGTVRELEELAGMGELHKVNPVPEGEHRGIFRDVQDIHLGYEDIEALARGLARLHQYGRLVQLLTYIRRGGHIAKDQ